MKTRKPRCGRYPWISVVSRLRMKDRICRLKTWPGTRTGKARRIRGDKGGGDHLLAGLHFLFHLIGSQVFAQAVVVAEEESPAQVALGRGWASLVFLAVAFAEAGWNPLKSGSGADGLVSRCTARS